MLPLRARVTNGRLVLNEPTTLPEGTEVEIELIQDELDDDDRARLHAALDEADAELLAGKGISGETLIAALRRGEL
jgi:predicted DNA-binding antitoxin AbrB/MazE fold protein